MNGPPPNSAAISPNDCGLLGDARLAAVEFDEQARASRDSRASNRCHRPHLQRVDQFDAGDRNAHLDGRDDRLAGRLDARKRADAAGDRLRDALQLQRDRGDDAERAFRADQQPRQIVAGRALLGALAGGDRRAVGHHGGQRQHVVAHRAVAHGIGARGARRRHAAEAGIGAGIDREEQAGVAQMRR